MRANIADALTKHVYQRNIGRPMHATGSSVHGGRHVSPDIVISRLGERADVLTSMVVDRTYFGATGNRADLELCELVGISQRLGSADNIH